MTVEQSGWSDEDLIARLQDPNYPEASAVLFERHHARLIRRLRKRHSSLRADETLFVDAATDAVLVLIQEPARFDVHKGVPLNTWLLGVASNKVMGLVRKEISHVRRLQRVADGTNLANTEVSNERPEDHPWWKSMEDEAVMVWLSQVCPDPAELKVAKLMYQGERRSETYAQCLGIQHLPVSELRAKVKQVKDRVQKRLKRRWGEMQNGKPV